MALQKILFKPGVNRENTRYTNEGGWYESDKVRFRQGTPEVIGGWQATSVYTYLGVCRSLWTWTALTGASFTGVGTNLKFYIQQGGAYNDITPIRSTVVLSNPFTASAGLSTIVVADVAHGCNDGDFVTFSGAVGLGGNVTATVLNQEYQITYIDPDSYLITVAVTATVSDTGKGGASVTAAYQVVTGPAITVPLVGWGSGGWGSGGWGVGSLQALPLRLWSQSNWGQDLVFAPNRGTIYYWYNALTVAGRGIPINTGLGAAGSGLDKTFTVTIANPAVVSFSELVLGEGSTIQFSTTGALPTGLTAGTTYYVRDPDGNTCNLSLTEAGALIITSGTQSGVHSVSNLLNVPVATEFVFVSDTFRFLLAFGCNPLDSTTQDPMIVRWSNQESLTDWYPDPVNNQAGELRLSHGSNIVTAVQTRQEIFVLTDSSAYSLQYVGPPFNWTAQLLGDNVSIAGPNAAVVASGIVYWMGVDKFYKYDGRIETLRCDLRQYIFSDINLFDGDQFFAGTVEGFNEIWWFYCSQSGPDGTGTQDNPNTVVDRYVVYNYLEDIWYYGTMQRTAWLDSTVTGSAQNNYPLAATYSNNIVWQEYGQNDVETGTPAPINAYILSSEFDIGDGHNFGFIWRVLPDLTFRDSTSTTPSVTMTLYPLTNSGSGYEVPASVGGSNYAAVSRVASVGVEQYTGQVYVRVRGRQLAFKIESNQLGTTWQLGAPRFDIKPDGRR
jgi:hypothetical protein